MTTKTHNSLSFKSAKNHYFKDKSSFHNVPKIISRKREKRRFEEADKLFSLKGRDHVEYHFRCEQAFWDIRVIDL